mmetsp:Transcript_21040/g.60087  ORF Transcript_21040/g.60087 Transcript_21040/m.60087 type:complete len:98 (+) Transcript_21040:99-392(+)
MSSEWRLTGRKLTAGGYKWRADEYYSREEVRKDHMLSPDWLDREVKLYQTFQKQATLRRSPSQPCSPSGTRSMHATTFGRAGAQVLTGSRSSSALPQ